jgi:cellulose synthase/poly-beta-1,6-N-acetylglucosamine synthase-like glycosyltransferase
MSLWPGIVVVYGLALLALAVYGLNHATLSVIFSFRRRQRRPAPPVRLPADPVVTIQLPLYNELYVAERVIRSACEIDYPSHLLEIQVLDDSTDETLELTRALVAEYQGRGISIVHLHRPDRQGFKAGALAYGLARARGEFVAVFDADFVVPGDFLRRTLQHFADPAVGIVQTRWAYFNETFSELTRVMALALDGHFVVEQSARCWAGWFLNFNGTAGILRTRAIADAGGWQDDTITEDLDLSYRAQLAGWRAVYLRDVACASEIPTDIHSIKTQQFRWTKGAQETARKILPVLWRSRWPLSVKCEGTIHLLSGLAFPLIALVTMLSPLAMIAAARYSVHVIQPILWVNWLALAGSFCCYCTAVHDLETNWRSRIARFPLFLVLSIGMSAHNTRAALEGIFGKKSPFERTPKYRVVGRAQDRAMSRYRSRPRYSLVGECVLGGVSLVSVACAIYLGQYAAVPFQMLFVAGYGLVLVYSIRHIPLARGEIRAADAPGSVPPRGASRPQPASTAASPSVA